MRGGSSEDKQTSKESSEGFPVVRALLFLPEGCDFESMRKERGLPHLNKNEKGRSN